ncbi:hypothetical protein OG883_22150 [Streptomyces sp. NBC_01142]|uniref:hypothetical protein n=1 Tax=Streptomyces sp. NBC_01142 TaxID=2975865 RepID=UPI0022518610|nr:hypothetical protein [Streptomyces sp. NBC_01142]MCX4822548.1 hypothetical protein [Streptomyces sp. NBC_01142]
MSSTQNTQESPRRRRSPLAVASVAAAVLVAGGGGAYFATAGFGGSGSGDADTESGAPRGDGNPPPLALDGRTGSGGPGSIAPGEPDPNGGVVYRAEGKLPEGPDKAAVHRTKGAVTEAEVIALAKTLGIPGTPRLVGTAWKIGADKDGTGPMLQVNKQAPGTWTFARFGAAPHGDNCQKADVCRSGAGAAAGRGAGAGTARGTDTSDRVPGVSEEAAKKAAAPVLKALGQSDAKLDARQVMGAVRVVNAEPVVGGLPTYGWTTGIQVGADGQVVGGSGQLKKPEKSHEYPVISADEALKQLNKAGESAGPIGIGGCATPVPLEGEQKPDAPCEPKSGKAAAPERLTINKAVFGLAAQYVGGQQALVPSWLFEVEPKRGAQPFTLTHPAVAPKFLKGSTPPAKDITPTGQPEDPAAPSERRVTSYSVDGRTLSLTFWGGACSDYAAKASESGDRVKVAITEKNPDPKRVCIMIAKELTEKVTLDKPLGDRKVVDADTGEAVPLKK